MPAQLVDLQTSRQGHRADVLATLENALADAKDGNIVAVAVAVVRPDGGVNTARSSTDNVGALLGAISLLQHRLNADIGQD